MVDGRSFSEDEVRAGAAVAVVNESAARLLFGATGVVGREFRSAFGGSVFTIVGLVRDMHTLRLDRKAPPMISRPFIPMDTAAVFTVRTSQPVDRFMGMLRERVRAWDASVVLRGAEPLDAKLQATVQDRVRAAALIGVLALLGLVIGSVGLYGTISAQVERRRREFGIRLALGASTRTIVAGVLRHGFPIVAGGVLFGLAGSAAAAALVRSQLFGIAPSDGVSFAAAVLLLSGAALVASVVPALRAAKIDPAETLRQE